MRGRLWVACPASVASCVVSDLTFSALRGIDLASLATTVDTVKKEGCRSFYQKTAAKSPGAGPFCSESIDSASASLASAMCIRPQVLLMLPG